MSGARVPDCPRGAGSHNANEYVELSSVLRTAETYLAAALEWCA